MNELYKKTIDIDGKIYQYDPDHDCYYRVPVELSTFDKYAWIIVTLVLLMIVLFLEYK